ncbi:MAG: hypothetical protein ABSH20_18905 [Tepidisphaeraceae bacterium]|jgi:hypothetical protein
MGDTTPSDFPAACSRVQRKLEQWRRQHRPGVRISAGLWREAAELARTHGINRTARALRLDYYSLKRRVAAAARSGERVPEFVELLPGGIPAPQPECLIEVEDPGGAKLRIHLQGGDFPDVAALTRAFREGRP